MALAPGIKLGIYEIQSPLGAGGMGEVYRATDTKLGRDVALKLLAPGALDKVSPEHVLREAQTASSLSQSLRFNGPVFAALDQLAPPQLLAGLAVPQRAKAKSLLTSDTRSDNILSTFRLLLGGFLGMAHHATRLHILGQFAHLMDPGKLASGL